MNPLDFLGGYKTYIVAVAMIIVGLFNSDMEMVMQGLAFGFIRRAIDR